MRQGKKKCVKNFAYILLVYPLSKKKKCRRKFFYAKIFERLGLSDVNLCSAAAARASFEKKYGCVSYKCNLRWLRNHRSVVTIDCTIALNCPTRLTYFVCSKIKHLPQSVRNKNTECNKSSRPFLDTANCKDKAVL